jgi:hypothetical protein
MTESQRILAKSIFANPSSEARWLALGEAMLDDNNDMARVALPTKFLLANAPLYMDPTTDGLESPDDNYTRRHELLVQARLYSGDVDVRAAMRACHRDPSSPRVWRLLARTLWAASGSAPSAARHAAQWAQVGN